MAFPLSGLAAGVVDALGVVGIGGLEGALVVGAEVEALDDEAEGTVPGLTAGLQAVRANVLKVINPNTLDMILPRVRRRWTSMV